LRTVARGIDDFRLHGVEAIAEETPRDADRRLQTSVPQGAHHAIAEQHISVLIHGDRAHPAVPARPGIKGGVLEQRRWIAEWIADFRPTHRGLLRAGPIRVFRHREKQAIRPASIPIDEPIHQAVAHGIEEFRGARLWDTGATAAIAGSSQGRRDIDETAICSAETVVKNESAEGKIRFQLDDAKGRGGLSDEGAALRSGRW
jgi:hypothetical protein